MGINGPLRWPSLHRGAVVLAVVAILVTAVPASAFAWHHHSYARETHGDPLFGARATRPDVAVTCVGTDPVYQPLWVIANYDNYVEVGTGHCFWGNPIWYSGYRQNDVWTWVDQIAAVGLSAHQMQLFRQSPCHWEWTIDVTVMNSSVVSWCMGGTRIEAGLESYGAYHGVPAFDTSTLRVFGANPTLAWRPWGGRDYQRVTSTLMCGRWRSDTTWRAGENTTC